MKVLSPENLPTSLPTTFTLVVYLLLKQFHPPGWFVGVCWTIMTIVWIVAIYNTFTEETVSLEELGEDE